MDSHSTMYLLKQGDIPENANLAFNSHSTMYLLKPVRCRSIMSLLYRNSHSTMYLLKLV